MTRILFICHGNICRSPMAEFIFKDMIKKQKREKDFYVASCATSNEEIWNGVGNPVYPPAKKELANHGISCEGKRAVRLVKTDYDKYDFLVCMDENNVRNALRILEGDEENKVSKLMHHAGKNADVSDPWYSGDFEKAYSDIYEGCKALFEKLK